jgi:GT2 family glycosyltransferase
MNCYIHSEKEAIGTCVSCGKFICKECNTEINNKNYCKKCLNELVNDKQKTIDKLEDNSSKQQPMVFMNAGGSSSSSSSSSSGYGRTNRLPYPTNSILIHIVLFFLTAGIGNIIYFLYIKNKQNQWRTMYR